MVMRRIQVVSALLSVVVILAACGGGAKAGAGGASSGDPCAAFQGAGIYGRVTMSNGSPVHGAEVMLKAGVVGSETVQHTGLEGCYRFAEQIPGAMYLQVNWSDVPPCSAGSQQGQMGLDGGWVGVYDLDRGWMGASTVVTYREGDRLQKDLRFPCP